MNITFNKQYCMTDGAQITAGPSNNPVVFMRELAKQGVTIALNVAMTDAELHPHGILPYTVEPLGKWQVHDLVITDTEVIRKAVADPNKTLADKQAELINQVRQHAIMLEDQITGKYPKGEVSRWPEYKAAIAAQDWSVFDNMAPDGMTGQEYAQNHIEPKIAPWTAFSDALTKTRNNHEAAIMSTPEADLVSYDITTGWPALA
jgi:hypothetical protein